MSRHEGVSCDSCLKGNFRGRRYKCLVCYDYDLCTTCYEAGATTTRHLTDHPMQCILTRTDFELYYGGEGVSVEQPQSLTCPYCTRMGFTEATLQEHVAGDHPDATFEVVCPVCASLPGGDPNHVTDDFANHLTVDHRSGPRDLISFLDEPPSSRHGPRRIPPLSRGVGGQRPRRSNLLYSSSGGLSPSSRDSIDPIAELLSQLSGVRRTGGGTSQSSQLQQLQMQLQLERQQVRAASRHQLERMPRRQPQAIGSTSGGGSSGSGTGGGSNMTSANQSTSMAGVVANAAGSNNVTNAVSASTGTPANLLNSMFLLPRCIATTLTDAQLQSIERDGANKGLFARELVISTLSQALPELTLEPHQQSPVINATPASTTITSISSPETTIMSANIAKKSPSLTFYEGKRETPKSVLQMTAQQLQIQSTVATGSVSGPLQNQGLPSNPIVQTLMQNVLPQSLVLQQSLSSPPIRNTGTGTIREPISVPAPAYLRGGVGPVGVTGPSRRKPVRSVDGRNQSSEPPPPH